MSHYNNCHWLLLFGVIIVFQILQSGVSEALAWKKTAKHHRRLDEKVEQMIENSLTNNKCCAREQKLQVIGKSLSGKEIQVDVGKCKVKCNHTKKLKKKEFKRLMKENPTLHPLEVYQLLSSLNEGGDSSCSEGSRCQPSASRIDRITTSEGVVSVKIIQDCLCEEVSGSCSRVQELITLHKNTPFETVVDVGKCRGTCSEELGCRPVITKTTSIEGPNGMECLPVIESCSCTEQCYRSSQFEHHFDYSSGVPEIKVIDIGRCGGQCEEKRGQECVQRESSEGACLMSLISSPSECKVMKTTDQILIQEDGSERNITKVEQCGCR